MDGCHGNWPVSAGLRTISISTSLGTVASAALESQPLHYLPGTRPVGGTQWVQPIREMIHLREHVKWLTPLIKKGAFTHKRMKLRCLAGKSLHGITHYLRVTVSVVYSTSKTQNPHSLASPRRETLGVRRKQGSQSVAPPVCLASVWWLPVLRTEHRAFPCRPAFPPERSSSPSPCSSPRPGVWTPAAAPGLASQPLKGSTLAMG